MKITQVTLVMIALVGYDLAAGYGGGAGSGGYGGNSGGTGAGGSSGYGGGAAAGGSSGFGGGAAAGGSSFGGGAGGSRGFGGGSSDFGGSAAARGSSFGGGAATGGSSFGGGAGGSRGFGGGSSRGGFGGGAEEAPKPYNFDYNSVDEQGNTHYRKELGDQNGRVSGTYGYQDVQGLYRIVEYVADENGFRANIRTNEPGVDGKENPADVQLTAEQPPAGIQDRFTSAGGGAGAGGSYGGASSGGAGGSYGGSSSSDDIPGQRLPPSPPKGIAAFSGPKKGAKGIPMNEEDAKRMIGK